MASNTCAYCAPPFFRFANRRSPIVFITRTYSFRPIYSSRAPTLRIASVHSNNHCSGKSAITSETASAIDFLTLCHSLKTTKRKGWINHGIEGPESIADHMYRMALMALIAGDLPGVNRERCIKIAIVHDIAEAIVGDITPSCGVPKEEKRRREQAALTEMCKILGGGMRAEEIQQLWEEYENNASLEANLVKDFDKLKRPADYMSTGLVLNNLLVNEDGTTKQIEVGDTEVELILQALEYEMEHGKVLDEFFLSTQGKFQTEIGKSWAKEINSRRKSLLADKTKRCN